MEHCKRLTSERLLHSKEEHVSSSAGSFVTALRIRLNQKIVCTLAPAKCSAMVDRNVQQVAGICLKCLQYGLDDAILGHPRKKQRARCCVEVILPVLKAVMKGSGQLPSCLHQHDAIAATLSTYDHHLQRHSSWSNMQCFVHGPNGTMSAAIQTTVDTNQTTTLMVHATISCR